MTVFRIVRSDNTEDPVLLNSFRSNYELGDEPRKVERSSTVVHTWACRPIWRRVSRTVRRSGGSKLGDYVAEVRLRHGHGFNFADPHC